MEQNHLLNRQIRIFISSTFMDMQDERNYLLIRTFPRLRELAGERGVSLTEIDLRWGITEDDSKNGKVVEICMREIENCIPFFIGIIGYRYGWIPNINDICNSPDMNDRFRWVYQDVESHLSVTEMEMQFGVLRRKDIVNAFFYIKNFEQRPTDIDYPDKLDQLIKTVKTNGRYPYCMYRTIEELSTAVEKDFIKLLDKLFPIDKLSSHEIERQKQCSYLKLHKQCYVTNSNESELINEFIGGEEEYLTIAGEGGTGKSALLANWIDNMNCQNNNYLVYYFINGASTVDAAYILEYWTNELLRHQGKASIQFTDEMDLYFRKSILEKTTVEADKPVIIILDNATIFQQCDNWILNTLDWLPIVSNKNKVIISSSCSDSCFTSYKREQNGVREKVIRMEPLKKDSVKIITQKYLKKYGKRLNDEQIEKIARFDLSNNAGILRTLLDELIYYGSFDTLDKFLDSVLGARDHNGFYEMYINYIEQYFQPGKIEQILIYLAISKYGLTETQMKDFLGFKPLEWSQAYCLLSGHIVVNSGYLQIANMDFHNAIKHKYSNKIIQHRTALIESLEGALHMENNKAETWQIWDELLFQCYTLGQEVKYEDEMADKVYHLILYPDVMWYLINKRASDIVSFDGNGKMIYQYWIWIYGINHHKYSPAAYLRSDFSDEDYLKRASDICDISLHVGDYFATIQLAFKAIDLFRHGNYPNNFENEYFKSVLICLEISARGLSLIETATHLSKLIEHFGKNNKLLPIDMYEKFLREYAILSINAPDNLQRFIDMLKEFDCGHSTDKAMAYWKISSLFKDGGKPEKALCNIELAIECMDSLITRYDDNNECIKAELLGTKGLILKDLHRYEDSYNAIKAAIIKYEDIEDYRIEHGNMIATTDDVERWVWEIDAVQELIAAD